MRGEEYLEQKAMMGGYPVLRLFLARGCEL